MDIKLVGEGQVPEISRAELLGKLDAPENLTSIERKNSRNPNGYFAYYVVSEDKISKIVRRNQMHALFYKIVECEDPEVEIYGDKAFRLINPPHGLEAKSSEEYFGVYIPKRYPEFFEILNRQSGQKYKNSYDDLNNQCLQFSAGAMTGTRLKSNLVSLTLP